MFAFITRFQTFHNMSFIRYQSPMTDGSITRYHTPAMQGRGLKEDVIFEVGPVTIESSQKALSKQQDGKSLSEVGTHFAQDIKRGVKRKAPAIVGFHMTSLKFKLQNYRSH